MRALLTEMRRAVVAVEMEQALIDVGAEELLRRQGASGKEMRGAAIADAVALRRGGKRRIERGNLPPQIWTFHFLRIEPEDGKDRADHNVADAGLAEKVAVMLRGRRFAEEIAPFPIALRRNDKRAFEQRNRLWQRFRRMIGECEQGEIAFERRLRSVLTEKITERSQPPRREIGGAQPEKAPLLRQHRTRIEICPLHVPHIAQ